MKIYFSPKTTAITLILAALMIRASYWQYERYNWKLGLISEMKRHLEMAPSDISEIQKLYAQDPEQIFHRRVLLSGVFDYEKEIVIRNRRFKDEPGGFIITPLKITNTDLSILVNRGFTPITKMKREDRSKLPRLATEQKILGLVKETATPKFMAPGDPLTGLDLPWADSWERVNVEAISKQIPYSILPFYIETMAVGERAGEALASSEEVAEKIIDTRAGREEMLILPMKGHFGGTSSFKDDELPIPVFDTVVPAGRHYGYIYEWAIMAFFTVLIGLLLQLRPPKKIQ
jgi:cytochrome oxidase assembly protein ShyY1